MVNLIMLTGDWIAGFSDGEAWFTIMIAPSKSYKLGFSVAPLFRIELQKADVNTLYHIRDFLGVGRVWINNQVGRRAGRGTYITSSLEDCQKIRDLFIKHPLQSKKQETFKLWSQALKLIAQKKHLTIEGLLELARIRDNMNQDTRRQSRMDYRDFNYFKGKLSKSNYQLGYFAK